MVSSQQQTSRRASGDTATVGRLFLLDLSDDRIVSLNSDGSDRKVIVTECRYPDGVAVDVAGGICIGPIWGSPTGTTALLSEPTATGGIGRRSLLRAAPKQ